LENWIRHRLLAEKMESNKHAESNKHVDCINGKHSTHFQYRWILIFQHAGREMYRVTGTEWYDTLQECEKAAQELDFDYCCSFSFEYQGRACEGC